MYRHHPKGKAIPALEQNILKYRALEMVLVLFYAEDLKRFALGSIRAGDCLRDDSKKRLPTRTKNIYGKLWAILVSEGILSNEESKEVQALIDYRNSIAHRIYELTCDLSREGFARDYARLRGAKYDYEARRKLKRYRSEISNRLSARHIIEISPDRLLFEAAERTYENELRRLDRKIVRQLKKRKAENLEIHTELAETRTDWAHDLGIYHPRNKTRNGRLTKRGIEVCHRLFEGGGSAMTVAYLMELSYRAAAKRRRAWEKAACKPDGRCPS